RHRRGRGPELEQPAEVRERRASLARVEQQPAVLHRGSAVTPDRLVDVANEPLVLPPLPHEPLHSGSLAAHAIGDSNELGVGPRRLFDEIAPVVENADVAVPGNGERASLEDDRLRGSAEIVASYFVGRKKSRKIGQPAGTRELGDPNGVDEEEIEIARASLER